MLQNEVDRLNNSSLEIFVMDVLINIRILEIMQNGYVFSCVCCLFHKS